MQYSGAMQHDSMQNWRSGWEIGSNCKGTWELAPGTARNLQRENSLHEIAPGAPALWYMVPRVLLFLPFSASSVSPSSISLASLEICGELVLALRLGPLPAALPACRASNSGPPLCLAASSLEVPLALPELVKGMLT